MKVKKIVPITFVLIFMIFLLSNPKEAVKGAVKGLVMCSDIVIPSLFPFSVCVLFLYKAGMFNFFKRKVSRLSRALFGLNGECLSIFIMSLLGGYPIGAILIENAYSENNISKRNAENMLTYCVNSGPAFIIIGIGNGIFMDVKVGFLLYASNFLASLSLALLLKRFFTYQHIEKNTTYSANLSDTFVKTTAQASGSMITICSFVVLFSTIVSAVLAIPFEMNRLIASFLEITNGCVIIGKNIYLLSFLLGFGGLSIHFQILSVLKSLKPSYIKFLLGRVIHGFLSLFYTYILFKIFPQTIETSLNLAFTGKLSSISLPFSATLIFMCATFLLSIKNRVEN